MTDTYEPKLFVEGWTAPATSVFAETAFSTDTPTLPLPTAMGWRETALSTDTATVPRELGFAIVQDDWT